MPLEPGARLGPYEIQSAVGAGGMGEVYKARDTRLERMVAIKVLPASLAIDAQFRERFEHEARTISQLDHPNICALYDVGEEQGTSFLVMQYLEGETLADRLLRGPLPIDQALHYASELASALDKAHRAGIVHRDVKPGNIMLTKSGAKLLDFGLARSGVPVLETSGLSMLPTTPKANLTVQGTILGTFQYMAPEQLEGQEADARTDIFAFGAVLYEMLTGRKAFEGKSQPTLIAAIVGSDPPPISTLQPIAPPLLDDVVRTCLAKGPDARWQSAADLQQVLALATKYRPPVPAEPRAARGTRWERTAVVVAVTLAVASMGTAAWLAFGRTIPQAARVSFDLDTGLSPSQNQIALSLDGTRLVSIVTTTEGDRLSIRRLDEVTPQTLAGTAGAQFPFWSPDGRFIAFFSAGKLNKIDIFGGPPQQLADAPIGYGGTWNRDGVIVFAPSANSPLFKVSAGGGLAAAVTQFDKTRGDNAHRHPKSLPDGRHFVFFIVSAKPENSGLYLGSLDSTDTRRLLASDAMGAFVPPDRLVFMRGATLMAQRFNLSRLEVEGDPSTIATDVGVNTGNSVAAFAFSNAGVLAYRVGGNVYDRVLRWVDRGGRTIVDVGGVAARDNGSLSPDGLKVVETHLDGGQSGDIWINDLVRGTSTRFTFDPAIDDNAIWSPDGNRLVFASARDGSVRNLYIKSAGGAGQEELLLKTDGPKYPTDWSRDGRYILYTEFQTSADVWALPLFGDRKPIPLLTTPFAESRARFSPDGRWVAYTSDESGGTQVYVQSFPPSGGKWQVSTSGGVEPHWRRDGRELFYVNGGLWAVDVSADTNTFKAGSPKDLFNAPVNTDPRATRYDVTADGQRFLLSVAPGGTNNTAPRIRIVLNWATGLNQ